MHSALERAVGLQVTVQSHVESTPPLGVGCALAWPSPWRRLASNTLERAIHMKSYQEQLYHGTFSQNLEDRIWSDA